jgi:O-antigen/teichoic acid export membrane protein
MLDLIKKRINSLSHGQSLVKGAAGSFILSIGGSALGFVLHVVLSRSLGVDSYGIYIYAYSWLNVLILIGLLGFPTASYRYVSEYYSNKQIGLLKGFIQYSQNFVLSASLLVCIGIELVIWFNRVEIETELFISLNVIALVMPFYALLKLKEAHLKGVKKVVLGQYPNTLIRPLIFIGGILFLFQCLGLENTAYTALLLHLFAIVISLVLIFRISHKHIDTSPEIPKENKSKEWFLTAKDMLLISGFSFLLFEADTIMIGYMVGTTESGIYAAASKIAKLMVLALVAVNTIFKPIVSDLFSKGEIRELNRLYVFSTQIIILSSTAAGLVLFFFGDWILGFFGTEFGTGFNILKILIVGQFINSFVGSTGVLINMSGHQSDSVIIMTVSSFLNILLNWLFIDAYGAIGAAYATALMIILTNIAFAILVWKRLGIIPLPLNFK